MIVFRLRQEKVECKIQMDTLQKDLNEKTAIIATLSERNMHLETTNKGLTTETERLRAISTERDSQELYEERKIYKFVVSML